MGRATQGVRLINLKGKDSIAAVAKVLHEEDEIEVEDIEDVENPDNAGEALDGTDIVQDDSEE